MKTYKNIPDDELNELAKEYAGNYQRFDSYMHFVKYDEPDKWCVIEPSHRDADSISRANTIAMRKELAKFANADDEGVLEANRFGGPVTLKGDFYEGGASHWAVGHVTQFHIRVYDKAGKITPAFTILMQMHEAIESYPILDEDVHTQIEEEDAVATIRSIGFGHLKDGIPEGWEHEVASELSRDGQIGDYEIANHCGEDLIFGAMKKLRIFEDESQNHPTHQQQEGS